MPEKYYQEYGPMRRRRKNGDSESDEPTDEARPQLEAPEERPARSERFRSERPRRRRSFIKPLLFVVVIGGIIAALPFASDLFASDRPANGVSVQGMAAAGMSRDALQRALEERYASFLATPITLEFESHTWTPTLRELGVQVDFAETALAATEIGRRGGPLERVNELWSLWQGGYDVSPAVTVNSSTLQAYLDSLAPTIEQPPRNAALSIAAGKVIPTPAEEGRQLLVDATARDILRAVQSLTSQHVVLRTRLLEPTLGDSGIAQAVEDAHTLLQQPLVLQQGERSWTWDQERVSQLLQIHVDGDTMTIAPDPAKLTRAVDDLAQVVDSPSAEPRVAFNGGKPKILTPGNTGWKLKQVDAATAISETLWLANRTLPLPVEKMEPQITAAKLPELGLKEIVGEGKTSFAGSAPYRVTNIVAGVKRMDGVLIAPGAEFSFNTQLGEVDEANGFVEGYAVIGNRTQLEWGGGVCQDSTTLFRAAFWAGLPITERHAHPFYISWYDDYSFPDEAGPGMDATIYTGVQDLKFLNDTGNWLLLSADVDKANSVVTMRLYGTKPNRTVSLVGPKTDNVIDPPNEPRIINDATVPAGTYKQTDTARKGMDISVYRVISINGEQQEPELFFTRFKAWPNVFVRGTGQ